MQTLIDTSDRLVQTATDSFTRYLYNRITWEERLIGLTRRMKVQKAIIAITRKILVIIYNVLKTKQPFDPNRNLQAMIA